MCGKILKSSEPSENSTRISNLFSKYPFLKWIAIFVYLGALVGGPISGVVVYQYGVTQTYEKANCTMDHMFLHRDRCQWGTAEVTTEGRTVQLYYPPGPTLILCPGRDALDQWVKHIQGEFTCYVGDTEGVTGFLDLYQGWFALLALCSFVVLCTFVYVVYACVKRMVDECVKTPDTKIYARHVRPVA